LLQLAQAWAKVTTLPTFNVFVAQKAPVKPEPYVKKMPMEKKAVLSNVRKPAQGLKCVIFSTGYADAALLQVVQTSQGDLYATFKPIH
jgi:hypothetical protein